MSNFDIVIVGASTSGSYFARRMAEKGFSVLAIEKDCREKISPDYDIFHMDKGDMIQFSLPDPDDRSAAFEFEDTAVLSSLGNHPKPAKNPVVGMHKREYIQQLNDWAVAAGAKIEYEATFSDFIYDGNGRVCGVTYLKNGETFTVNCRLVADCSGIPAVARRRLPDGYGMEKFELTPDDVFFVVLKYIKFAEEKPRRLRSDSWIFYKAWLAPSSDDADGILGIGSNFGYDYAEKMFDLLTKNVKFDPYTIVRTERGMTPYHRPPFSFAADGFVAMGDSACLTKPTCGEGCTSAMVLIDIVTDVAGKAMQNGAYPTRESLWSINKRYVDAQGKDFAFMLALLCGVIRHSVEANEYLFAHDIIFSKKILGGMGEINLTVGDICKMIYYILTGLASGKLKSSEIKCVFGGLLNGLKIMSHYSKYPEKTSDFDNWVKKAEALWKKAGSMSDWKLLK